MGEDPLTETNIYEKDGLNYVYVKLLKAIPNKENMQQFYDILDYIPSLNKKFYIIIDTREADFSHYISYLADFCRNVTNRSGSCVINCEVYIGGFCSHLVVPILQPVLDSVLCSNKIKLVVV